MDDELTGEPSESGADVEGLSALAPGDVHDVMMSATWALNLRQKRSRVAVPCVHTSVSPPTMRTNRPGRISPGGIEVGEAHRHGHAPVGSEEGAAQLLVADSLSAAHLT